MSKRIVLMFIGKSLLTLAGLIACLAFAPSCSIFEKPPAFPLIQVWQGERLLADGVAVGNGSHVLTVLDYEWLDRNPDDIHVIFSGFSFTATIQTYDTRTGATLLEISGTLPVSSLVSINNNSGESQVYLGEIYQPDIGRPPSESYEEIVINNPSEFSYHFHRVNSKNNPFSDNALPGSVVYDKQMNVVGLVGRYFWGLIPPPSPGPQPVLRSEYLVELLEPDAASQPWTTGPVSYMVSNYYDSAHPGVPRFDVPANYDKVTSAVALLLNQAGRPIALDDLLKDQPWFLYTLSHVSEIVLYYANPITITGSDGTVLVEAKWIAINWGMDRPNRLVYGDQGYISGGFEIGDIGVLLAALS